MQKNHSGDQKMKPKTFLAPLSLALALVIGSAILAADVPSTSQVVGYLEQAKQLTAQKKFDEAIARAEAAIAQLRQLREAANAAALGSPDLVVVSISGDGDRGVTV